MSREGTISTLDVPISDDVLLSVLAVCYAPSPVYPPDEPCDVGIYAFGSGADDFRFTNLGFTVDVVDPQSAQVEVQARVPDFGSPPPDYATRTWPVKVWIDLSYQDIPQEFVLNLPRFSVGRDSYQPPSVTFSFQRNVDVVPLLW